eukprot:TRINITY_DN2370_c0_g2_i1.p1 TRINITY_DN2370_c0_g2~~TRINITY_DN2370_c0_g2_i1.p1  ORF type:complete len:331 (-),score=54.87 TRINITY_DN2370_c0_g2_i1:25-1017(-)
MQVRSIALSIWTCLLICVCVHAQSYKWKDCDVQDDGVFPYNGTRGDMDVALIKDSWNDIPVWVLLPFSTSAPSSFPVMLFMHGTKSQFEQYTPTLGVYASHGFIVVYPYIKGVEEDKSPFTTNTDGKFLISALDFARAAQVNTSSPLFGKFDLSNVVISGHSMGATCSIRAAASLPVNSGIKLVITQHPGVCGPFGPPPYPETWMPADLSTVTSRYPTLFTTATNDAAFWPAPYTAVHELGCFKKGVNGTSIFAQFNTASCGEDGALGPFSDGGHNCALKNAPESGWVLVAMKLYTQQQGNPNSVCYQRLWGQADFSLQHDRNVEIFLAH